MVLVTGMQIDPLSILPPKKETHKKIKDLFMFNKSVWFCVNIILLLLFQIQKQNPYVFSMQEILPLYYNLKAGIGILPARSTQHPAPQKRNPQENQRPKHKTRDTGVIEEKVVNSIELIGTEDFLSRTESICLQHAKNTSSVL